MSFVLCWFCKLKHHHRTARLEQYSWRDEEVRLNAAAPQFRTAFMVPGSETAIRIHFIHARSPHANAVPLLLIPPFPFSNLSLSHLIPMFTDPDDASSSQPFHLVIPSLPGLGFSDALPNNTPMIPTSAELYNILMQRLDYSHYIGSTAGSSATVPSEIDWKLSNHLVTHFSESCLAFHIISPVLKPPKLKDSPAHWARWKFASITKRPAFGYSAEDVAALQRTKPRSVSWLKPPDMEPLDFDLNGFREPNTLSYALCDSPVGLLLFVLMLLRVMGPEKKLSPKEIITLTQLTWLPGPEATLRFWAHCASFEPVERDRKSSLRSKPKIGLTVFDGNCETRDEEYKVAPRPVKDYYACPRWADSRYEVVSTNRVAGRPGLLAWKRPEVIVNGCRDMAKSILAVDDRMQASEHPGGFLLAQVTAPGGEGPTLAEISGTTMQGSVADGSTDSKKMPSSSAQLPAHTQAPEARPAEPVTPERRSPGENMADFESGGQSIGSSPSTVIALNPQKQTAESR